MTDARPVTAVDVRAHYLGPDAVDPSAPRSVVDSASAGRIMCGEVVFREMASVL